MSHKGAIKKAVEPKNVSHRAGVSQKTRSKRSNDATTEVSSSAEPKDAKVIQSRYHKTAGDIQQKSSQNTSEKVTRSRITSKDKLGTSQAKVIMQNSLLSSARSGPMKSPRYGAQLTNKPTTSGTKLDKHKVEERRLKNSPAAREESKAKEKYSEKRGTSSIYLPKTTKSSIVPTSKVSSQITGGKASSLNTMKARQRAGNMDNIDKVAKNMPRRSSRERRRSRTLSPSEVKILHSAMKADNILNNGKYRKNNTSEDFSQQQNNSVTNKEGDEYEYEDDFEDYESDFQECTDSDVSQVSEEAEVSNSPEPEPIEMQREEQVKTVNSADGRKTEEEHMLDSGHYELTEARKRAARIESLSINQPKAPLLQELKQPINKAYRQEKMSENKSLPLSSTDEGFEDGRSGDFTKSSPISQISFIDFQKPKMDRINKIKLKSKSKRGEDLLNMIKLDIVEWSLIEYTPIAYEDFILNYGRLNTQQISVQTNEDNLEVETQTEVIELNNKWTQFPITCRKNLQTTRDVKLFKLEQVGVGEDTELDAVPNVPSYDVLQLNDFLSKAGKVMLSLLEERKLGGHVMQRDSHELPFSDGLIKLAVDSVSFLVERPVSCIQYSETLNRMLLTIHVSNNEGIETLSKEDYLTDCCIGCVWRTSEPSRPIKLFYAPCSITACCFHATNYNVVVAGLQDGSINLWDLREDEMWHQKVTDKVNEVDWILRSPTYTTADDISEYYHSSEIVAIRILSGIDKADSNTINNKLAPIQICTLDEEGELIIWSVLYTMGIGVDDLGLAQWGDIRLQKSQRISLEAPSDSKKCFSSFFDLHVDSVDTNNLFLATNWNNILHATCIGNKVAPNCYRGNEMECAGATRCLEICPFKQSYFLAGFEDGSVRLHSPKIEKALLQLKDQECISPVKSLQWSKSKPLTIFVLDSASKIHIWNLSNSDIYPMYSISTKKWGCISSMQLSPCRNDNDMMNQYLALGTDNGRVEIHKLKKDFCYTRRNESKRELETFLRYVDIL